ncbi:CshA/CshB family fibrillar adhesin-related protein [Corynebacterium vitaeruminis]|uniref:CshA/CshB family fibrillar adhesin-related protein n=2 Tax=Corynebacterium vitaeruminis TaxID=38305 RepID=UPI000553BF36|nr:CshA/CshB family fibrillar adhesin-related protein [Corynebacterium vitaeruminis]
MVVLFSVAKPAQAQDADLVDSLNQLNTALDAATADTTADTTTDLTGLDATDAAATETAADTSTLDGITAIDQSLMGVNSQLMSLDAAVSGAAASGTVNQDVPVGFATGGSGRYKDDIQWIKWDAENAESWDYNNPKNLIQNVGDTFTQLQTRDLGEAGSLQTKCTITLTANYGAQAGNGVRAYRPGNFGGDGLDDLYNVGGTGTNNQLLIGLANSQNRSGTVASTTAFNYSCEARLVAANQTYDSGTKVPLQGLVFADAESNTVKAGITESISVTPKWDTTDHGWYLIDRFRSGANATSSCATDETLGLDWMGQLSMTPTGAECYSDYNASNGATEIGQGPMGVTFAKGSTSANVTLRGRGFTGVALGVLISTDFGDAPKSYGEAGSIYQPAWTGSQITNGSTVMTQPLASLTTDSVNPVLGSKIDSEAAQLHSNDASGDDNRQTTNYDDEDGLDGKQLATDNFELPANLELKSGGTYQVQAQCKGAAGARVAGWIDWNSNNKFDSGEMSNTVNCSGTPTVTLTFTMPADVNPKMTVSFLRLRTTLDAGDLKPTGVTTRGEVEDYPLYRTVVRLKKQVDNNFGGTAKPDEWQLTAGTFNPDKANNAIDAAEDKSNPVDTTGKEYKAIKSGTNLALKEQVVDTSKTYGYELKQLTCTPYTYNFDTQKLDAGTPQTWNKDNVATAAITPQRGTYVECVFENQDKPSEVTWNKIDQDTKAKIAGSEWKLVYTPNDGSGDTETTVVDNSDPDKDTTGGAFKLTDLKRGTYKLYETKAPDGYLLAPVADGQQPTPVKEFELTGKDNELTQALGDFTNSRALQFVFTKVGEDPVNAAGGLQVLSGAEFAVYYDSKDNPGTMGDKVEDAKVTKDDDATWHISNVPAGTYWIVETKSPVGYNLLAEPIKISLTATLSIVGPDGSVVNVENSNSLVQVTDGAFTMRVENTAGGALPKTGGLGVGVPIAVALALVAAGAFLARRRS